MTPLRTRPAGSLLLGAVVAAASSLLWVSGASAAPDGLSGLARDVTAKPIDATPGARANAAPAAGENDTLLRLLADIDALRARIIAQLQARGATVPGAGTTPGAPPETPALPPAPGKPPLMEGFDDGKLGNPAHRTPKYIFARIAQRFSLDGARDPASGTALLKKLIPLMRAQGLEVGDEVQDGDKIKVKTEAGWQLIDVIRGLRGDNPAWQWLVFTEHVSPPSGGSPGTSTPPPGENPPAGPAPGAGEWPASVPQNPEYAKVQIDKSSSHAAMRSTAQWVRDNKYDLFPQNGEDNRQKCVEVMSWVVGILRANGFDATRVVNHASLPPSNPVRWGSDAVKLDGHIYDLYGSMGEANKVQILDHGADDKPGRPRD